MAQLVLFSAFALFQFISENPAVVLAVQEEVDLLRERLRTRPAWARGPTLSLTTVLSDLATANAALRRRVTVSSAARHHYVLSLTYTGRPRAYLRALRLGRTLASLVGDVALDVELRRNARRKASAEDAVEPLHAVRRCSLESFYSFLRPALEQLAADESAQTQPAKAPRGEEEQEECSICFAAAVDTVAPCSHAFCADCYERWRRTAHGCALCRQPLPSERGGAGAWVLTQTEAGDAAEARLTAARIADWLQALPRAS